MDWKKASKSNKKWLALIPVVIAAVILIFLLFRNGTEGQSTSSLEDAVVDAAAQCYAVEGVYPPSLEYLEEHYGLVINHDRYIVSYDAFSSNLPPTIKVLIKGEG